MKKRAIGKTVFLVLLALILLALLGYTAGLLYPRGARAGDNSGLGDWMGRLDGKLRLSEINIPGTHDSATQYIFPSYFLRDQDTGVQEQLENGYRYLDVRVALDKDGKELKLIHAFGTCRRGAALWSKALSYDDFCDAALAFLDAHPGETVIFCVKPESSGDDPAAVRALIEARAALEPDKWYTDNTIPTLDEARGRIVLCRRYDGALGLDFDWADQGDPSVLENPVEAHAIGETESLFVQDRYHYAVADKWQAVRFTLEKCRAGADAFSLNFLSTAQGKLPHPLAFAREMNALFADEKLEKGGHYGIILFDFASAELARQVVESNA